MKKLFTLVLMCTMMFSGFAQDPGTLDPTFGNGGVARMQASNSFDMPFAMLTQEDGKIITVGKSRTDGSNYSVYVSRQNADGSMDATYGDGGFTFFKADPLIYLNEGRDAVWGNDGLLFIAGHTYDYVDSKGFILCIDENGFPYPYFGEDGFAISEAGGGIVYEGIDVDSNGRPVVCGYKNDTLMVRRYNAVGQPDPSFGNGGTVMIPFESEYSFGFTIEVLPDNKILVGGASMNGQTMAYRPFVVKFKANGTLDNTFGDNGIFTFSNTEGAEFVLDIALAPDGNYIIAGHSEIVSGSNLPQSRAYVSRVLTNGTIDESFGDNGFTFFESFSGEGCENSQYGITVADDGQIFGTYYAYNHATFASRAYVYNVDADGQLKENFAGTGIMPFTFSDPEVQTSEILLQDDGTLLVSGYLFDGNWSTDVFVAKIHTDIIPEDPAEPASIELTAEAVDAYNVKATATPNEHTVEYHVGIVTKAMFDQVGEDALAQALQTDNEPYTGVQEILFDELTPVTEYVVIATGKNAEDVWMVTTTTVTTPQGVGFDEFGVSSFEVYPNPATSVVYVKSSSNNAAQISIIDLTGRCVKVVETTDNVTTISTDDINKGVYFIMIQQNDNKVVEKLIVK